MNGSADWPCLFIAINMLSAKTRVKIIGYIICKMQAPPPGNENIVGIRQIGTIAQIIKAQSKSKMSAICANFALTVH